MRRMFFSIGMAFMVSVLLSAACGATAGTSSGELMFDLGGEDEEDAGADSGRRPLSLDGGR